MAKAQIDQNAKPGGTFKRRYAPQGSHMRSPSSSSPVMKRIDQRPSPSAAALPSMGVELSGTGGLLSDTTLLGEQLGHATIGDMSPSDITFLTNFDGLDTGATIAGSGSNQIVLPPGVSLPTKKSRPTSRKTVDPNDPKNKAKAKRKGEAPQGPGGSGRWTKDEDAKLRAAVAAVGAKNWKRISQEFLDGRRSDVQCLHRWNKVLKPGLVKGPWTQQEDEIIRSCIQEGITKWSEIAAKVPGRIGKQCRERWFNHLDPSIKKSEWSDEEDRILITAQAQMGNKWCEIAKLLPGRSENAVKNRWNSATRRKQQLGQGVTVRTRKPKSEGAKGSSSNKRGGSSSSSRGSSSITPTARLGTAGLDDSTSPSWGNLLPADMGMGMGTNFGSLGGLMGVGVSIDAAGLPVPPGMEGVGGDGVVGGAMSMDVVGDASIGSLDGLSPCVLPMPGDPMAVAGLMPPPPPAPAPAGGGGGRSQLAAAKAADGGKSQLHEKLLSHLFKAAPAPPAVKQENKTKQEKPAVSADFAAQEADRLQLFSGVSFSSQEKQQLEQNTLAQAGVGVGAGISPGGGLDVDACGLGDVSQFDLEHMFDLLPGKGKGKGGGGKGGVSAAKGRGRGAAVANTLAPVKFTVKGEQQAWGIAAPPAIDTSPRRHQRGRGGGGGATAGGPGSTTSSQGSSGTPASLTNLPGFTPPSASTRAAVLRQQQQQAQAQQHKQQGKQMESLEASLDDLDIAITCAPLTA